MALTDPIRYGDAAGGALQGTYPNPDLQDGYIQTRHISLEAITNELIAAGAITGDKLSSGSGLGEIITTPENIASGIITSAHLADIITYIRTQGNQNLSGIKSFERALQYRWPTIPADVTNKHYVDSMILSGTGSNPNLEPYISGIGALTLLNQGNIVYLTSYASGTKTLLNIVQANQTATANTLSGVVIDTREIESYASGVEAMRRVMTSANPQLEAFASGINTTVNIIQTNLTSNTNTLSGVITDLQELTEYASGIGARPSGGGSSTATGSSIRQTYTQTHDFVALNAIYRTTGEQWAKAKADNVVTAESIGIIESVSGNQFTVVFEGEIENQTGLLAGFTYFLSASNAGEITPTEPVTSGTISKPVMNAISDTKGIVVSYRGILNGVSGSSTGSDCTEVIAYASGIETMRRAMVLTSDTTAVTNYASGINGQLISFQNETTTNIQNLTQYTSGNNALTIINQTNITNLTTSLSGVQEQVSDFQSVQTTFNTNIESYASGIETMRQAMVLSADVTNITNYASGINGQIVLVQNELTANTDTTSGIITELRELTDYASGIETLRQAMVLDGDVVNITNYASGINNQLILVQQHLSEVESYASGTAGTGSGDATAVTTYASGISTQVINIQNEQTIFNTNITNYGSGINDQLIDIQTAQTATNIVLSNTISGVNGQLVLVQNELTATNNTLSGIITDVREIETYGSGTKTLVNTIQTKQTSIDNTVSGLTTDVREIESYCSGNKILLLNHADQHREGATDDLGVVPFSGFVNRTSSNFVLSGYAIQIVPDTEFVFYTNGHRFVKTTTQQIAITEQNKQHYVYFDANGDIQVSTTMWMLASSNIAPCAIIYRNNLNFAVGDERHSYQRIPVIHEAVHDGFGTVYNYGFGASFGNSTFLIDSGEIHDEDLEFDISAQTACRLWHRNSDVSAMTIVSGSTTTPYATAGTLQWDNNGTLTNVGVSKFVCNYVYATDDIHYPIYIIVGQAEHNTIALARNDNLPTTPEIYTREWKLLYRVIYQNLGGTPTYVESLDLRRVNSGPGSSYTPASHTDLTNRDAANSHPVTAITGLDSYLSGTKTLINLNQSDIVSLESYASGIETMREMWNPAKSLYGVLTEQPSADTLDSGTLFILRPTGAGARIGPYYVYKNPADGTHSWVQFAEEAGTMENHTNVYNHDYIESTFNTVSGIATDIQELESFTSGINTLANLNQSDISRLEPILSGIQSAPFFVDNRELTHIVPNAIMLNWQAGIFYTTIDYWEGYNNLYTVSLQPHVIEYWSGTRTQSILNQSNITNLTSYASGIETLRQSMTTGGDTTAVTNYASGINAYTQLLAPRTSPFWMQDRSATEITGGAGLAFNSNDFSAVVESNPGLLEGYEYSLNTKYASSISGVKSNLVNTQNRVTVLEGSSGGNATKQTITHDDVFETFKAVYKDSNNIWQYSKANILENSEVVGVVESTSGNSSTIVTNGTIANNLITAGLVYYLSDVTDGALQTSEATNISKPVMIGIDSGVGIVQIFRSLIVSGSSDAVALPMNYLAGMETAPYTTSGISVSAGKCRSKEVAPDEFNIIATSTNIKKLTGPFVAGSLQNGIDSGNRAANTTYHVYEITDGNGTDTLFSTSATSPSLPVGYVAARRIWSFRTDSTGYINKYTQINEECYLETPVLDANAVSLGITASLITLSIPTGIRVKPIFSADVTKAATYVAGIFTSPDSTDLACVVATLQATDISEWVAGGFSAMITNRTIWSNTSAQIRARGDTASSSLYIKTFGWIDTRGK